MSGEKLRVVTYLSELVLVSCYKVEVLGHRGGGSHLEIASLERVRRWFDKSFGVNVMVP
jgi:hypothetical protein